MKNLGDKCILGRVTWLWANVLFEGEANVKWESPDGKLIDVIPNDYNEKRLLFLEDSNMIYNDMVIGSIRMPLTDSPDVKTLKVLINRFYYMHYKRKGSRYNC